MKEIDDSYIDLIYCDVLFNTGKKFKCYTDKLGTTKEAVEWYTPRIMEMKRILKNTGTIYIHCDWRLSHYLKVLMDVIFGEQNFINDIIWHYRRWTGNSKGFLKMHDNILMYSKSKDFTFNTQWTDYTDNSLKRKQHYHTRIKDGAIFETEINTKGVKDNDVWQLPLLNSQSKERVGYDTQKPKKLLEKIIMTSSNEGDTIADFFCGSGTSLIVAKELKRNFIGCDINEKAVSTSNVRLLQTKEGEEWQSLK